MQGVSAPNPSIVQGSTVHVIIGQQQQKTSEHTRLTFLKTSEIINVHPKIGHTLSRYHINSFLMMKRLEFSGICYLIEHIISHTSINQPLNLSFLIIQYLSCQWTHIKKKGEEKRTKHFTIYAIHLYIFEVICVYIKPSTILKLHYGVALRDVWVHLARWYIPWNWNLEPPVRYPQSGKCDVPCLNTPYALKAKVHSVRSFFNYFIKSYWWLFYSEK